MMSSRVFEVYLFIQQPMGADDEISSHLSSFGISRCAGPWSEAVDIIDTDKILPAVSSKVR